MTAHPPSNKPPPFDTCNELPFAFETATGTVRVSAPFIDRLTLSAPILFSDVVTSTSEPQPYLASVVKGAHVTLGQTMAKGAPEGLTFKQKGRVAGFFSGNIRLGPDGASTSFSVARSMRRDMLGYDVRIELNPERLTPAGLQEVATTFAALFLEEVKFEVWLSRAQTRRFDIAVDLVGVSASDLIFREVVSPLVWSDWKSGDFKFETRTLWREQARPSVLLRSCVYDKRAEQLKRGKHPKYGDAAHTRVEFRRTSSQRSFRNLLKLPNELSTLRFGYLPDAAEGMPWNFRLFVDACQSKGRAYAQVHAPPDLIADFSDRMEQDASFWKPDDLWTAFESSLKRQGLFGWLQQALAA